MQFGKIWSPANPAVLRRGEPAHECCGSGRCRWRKDRTNGSNAVLAEKRIWFKQFINVHAAHCIADDERDMGILSVSKNIVQFRKRRVKRSAAKIRKNGVCKVENTMRIVWSNMNLIHAVSITNVRNNLNRLLYVHRCRNLFADFSVFKSFALNGDDCILNAAQRTVQSARTLFQCVCKL